MYSKIILLIGGVLSSLVVFYCLKDHYKERKSLKNLHPVTEKKDKNKNNNQDTNKSLIKIHKVSHKINKVNKINKINLKEPTLIYKDHLLEANLSKLDKNKINSFIQELNCSKHITYNSDVNNSSWLKLLKDSIKFFNEKNITNIKIKAYNNTFEINTTFTNQNIYKDYKSILEKYQNININNFSILKKQKIIKNKNTDQNISKKQTIDLKQLNSVEIKKIQKKINTILKRHPIYFKFDSDLLIFKSKKTLNKIIRILNKTKATLDIKVEGHSNAIGNETYNKNLSQKRANSVKKYLKNHCKNIKTITSKGYGSQRPKYKNPKDRRNRRVEIIVIRGQR